MRWLCLFLPCRWVFLTNVKRPGGDPIFGLYQCQRCKTVSVGNGQFEEHHATGGYG